MSGVKVFVLGFTGETGKSLVKQLAQDEYFTKVVLIGRREVDLDLPNASKFDQKVINFDEIDEYKDAFSGCDVGFCCLGTTRAKGGLEHFIKVDRDYVVNSARVAKDGGCKHIQVVTATGANKNSFITYNKTKGEVEELLKELDFNRLSIFRPGLLLGGRVESRPGESCVTVCMFPCNKLCPRTLSVHFDVLARAMLKNAKIKKPPGCIEALDNRSIHSMAESDVVQVK